MVSLAACGGCAADSGSILTAATRARIVARLVNRFRRMLPWLGVSLLAIALLAAVLRLAWLSDDAYITLRSVENLLDGHGPVWNVGERVQTYTHPAWFWLLALARWLTGEHYFTTIALSVALTAVGVALLAALARKAAAIAALLLLLLGSRAFGDFATSGLETPLVTVLLVWLGWLDHHTPLGARRLLPIAFVVGWCGLVRLDLLLLCAPVLLAHLRADRPVGDSLRLGVAMAPLLGWSGFATWYYGSPFPITAYAKALAPGLPTGELIAQGLRYTVHTATGDPLTLVAIAAGIVVGFGVRAVRGRMLALGIVLQCLYVLRVGGDFMAGRFFVPPLVAACVLLARWLASARPSVPLAVAGFAAGAMWLPGVPPWLQPLANDLVPAEVAHGIQDERRFYWKNFGLFSPQREIPQAGRFSRALQRQGRTRPIVLGAGMAGGIPFVAGPAFHFVDPWLCDPLLMRLPVLDPGHWRIGHFTRGMPAGYPESIAFGDNRLTHPGLARFYTTLRAVLRAPLGSDERWLALQTLLLGADHDGLQNYASAEYRRPERPTSMLSELMPPAPVGTFWFDAPAVRCIGRGGLRLRTTTVQRARTANVHVVPLIGYRFTFRHGGKEVGRVDLPAILDPGLPPAGDDGDVLGYLQKLVGLQAYSLPLPGGMPVFDTVDVDARHVLAMDNPPDPWLVPAIGGLVLLP